MHACTHTHTPLEIKLSKGHEKAFHRRGSLYGLSQECKPNWLNVQSAQCLWAFGLLRALPSGMTSPWSIWCFLTTALKRGVAPQKWGAFFSASLLGEWQSVTRSIPGGCQPGLPGWPGDSSSNSSLPICNWWVFWGKHSQNTWTS